MRIHDVVSLTCHNAVGNVAYVGTGRIEKIRKSEHGTEFIVACEDGKKRAVSQGDKRYAKDTIMVL